MQRRCRPEEKLRDGNIIFGTRRYCARGYGAINAFACTVVSAVFAMMIDDSDVALIAAISAGFIDASKYRRSPLRSRVNCRQSPW